jgi:hypothetical protein
MEHTAHSMFARKSLVTVAVLVCCFSPIRAVAQGSQGQDAVYNSSNGIVGSSSFIDASTFVTQTGTNICGVLGAGPT